MAQTTPAGNRKFCSLSSGANACFQFNVCPPQLCIPQPLTSNSTPSDLRRTTSRSSAAPECAVRLRVQPASLRASQPRSLLCCRRPRDARR
eukprot:1429413-Rhodomonas_salina.1